MTDADLALDALGHPTRRGIVRVLARGPQPVGAIARQLPVTRPAVSQHLRVLEDARLVSSIHVGRKHVFRLESAGRDAVLAWLAEFWDDALDRFARLAEATWSAE